jgi:tetratricopeptide (TPR) repeat protein
VAFSPDGTRLASGSDDNTVKVWDVASGKEIAAFEGSFGSVMSVAFSPDGTRLASGSDDNSVKLWDTSGPGTYQPNLVGLLQARLLEWEEAKIPPTNHPNLYTGIEFPTVHARRDEVIALAAANLSAAEAFSLRLRLLTRTGQWRAARVQWAQQTSAPNLADRKRYLHLLLIRGLRLAESPSEMPAIRELVQEILNTVTKDAVADIAVSSPLSEWVIQTSTNLPFSEEPAIRALETHALQLLATPWQERIGAEVLALRDRSNMATNQRPRLDMLIHALAERNPGSPALLRGPISLAKEDPARRIEAEDRLLALTNAAPRDWGDAIYAASKEGNRERALDLYNRSEATMSTDVRYVQLWGWSCIHLGEAKQALEAFERANREASPFETSVLDIPAGIALANWLLGDEAVAVESYRKLIERGPVRVSRILRLRVPDWADPATITSLDVPDLTVKKPLEQLRQQTLKKHPELAMPQKE